MPKLAVNLARTLLLVSAVAVVSGCEPSESPAPVAPARVPVTAPDTAADAPTAPPAPAVFVGIDAGPTTVAPTPDAGADADAAAEPAKSGGVLPEPDFNLKGPTLTAPSLGGKKGLFETGEDAAEPEDKGLLLDTELKKK